MPLMPREIGWPPEAIKEPEKVKLIHSVLTTLVGLEQVGLIDEAAGEAIADIDVRRSVFAADVVGIQRNVAAVEGAKRALHLAGIGCTGPGVVGEELKAVCKRTTHRHSQRVVPGVGNAESRC